MNIWNNLDISSTKEYYYLIGTEIPAFTKLNKGLILPNVPKSVGIFKFVGESIDYPNSMLFSKPISEEADIIIVPKDTFRLHIKLLAEYVIWKN